MPSERGALQEAGSLMLLSPRRGRQFTQPRRIGDNRHGQRGRKARKREPQPGLRSIGRGQRPGGKCSDRSHAVIGEL